MKKAIAVWVFFLCLSGSGIAVTAMDRGSETIIFEKAECRR